MNYKLSKWTKLLLIAKLAYNNTKTDSIRSMLFELNCRYYPRICYKNNVNSYSSSKSVDKLATRLKNLMAAYRNNIYYEQKMQKQAYSKKN